MKDEQYTQTIRAMRAARPSSTLVIGLGNPILGDDGVGWKVVQHVSSSLDAGAGVHPDTCHSAVETDCLSLGGLSLMERMLGYEKVIIVDSMETGRSAAGSVAIFPLSSMEDPVAGHSTSAHDTSLMTALETAKVLGLPIPKLVNVVAIEVENVYDFCEELSPAVARAVPLAVQAVMDLLKEEL